MNNKNLTNLDNKFVEELSKVMPTDFKDWFQNSPEELPIIARNMIEDLKKENEMLWSMIDNVNSALDVSKYYEQ
jgi:hypothetical protein